MVSCTGILSRGRSWIVRLVPLVEARAAFLSKIAPVASAGMATAKAGGLVLAEDVRAASDVPPAALELQRGFAIASRASVGASSYLPALQPLATGSLASA